MRLSFLFALILAVVAGGTYWYQEEAFLCPVPVEYRLGTIDDSFNVTRMEAMAAIQEATAVWEEVSPVLPLFTYDEDADLVVNFVFDDRQATANAQEVEQLQLDSARERNEEIKGTIAELQENYDDLQLNFLERKESYDTSLAVYNEEVQQINDQGGATDVVYDELRQTQSALELESESLRERADELNRITSQLNQLSAEGNRLIQSYNEEVVEYNDHFAGGEEFTQGDYTGDSINIYKFSNNAELVSVLAHEFGHALGILHVETEGSLMHYLLAEDLQTVIPLSDDDTQALNTVCQPETHGFKIRSIIRSIIS